MSLVKVAGNASGTGTLTIQAPNTNSNYQLDLPTAAGTIQVSGNPISGTTGTFSSTISGASTIGVGGATPSASGAGITFPATQSASSDANTLDDYEEGTWTPIIGGEGGQSGQSYTQQQGAYTKIGRLVYCSFIVQLSTKGTITGNVVIDGLPFTISNSLGNGSIICEFANMATNWVVVAGRSRQGYTQIRMCVSRSSAGTISVDLSTSDIGNTTALTGSFVYQV